MANPLANQKKIRGWRRRVKQIEQWKQHYLELDMEELERNHRDYVKLWIDPFYRLTRRNPPVWYARLLLAAMIEVYQSWSRQMRGLDEPYYLKIWLYHPHFINSQIVVAFREALHFYDHTFDPGNDNKAFPTQLYGTVPGLQPFQWELAIDADRYWLSDLQEDINWGFKTEKDIEAIQDKAYASETVRSGAGEDTVYKVRVGDVWLGEIV